MESVMSSTRDKHAELFPSWLGSGPARERVDSGRRPMNVTSISVAARRERIVIQRITSDRQLEASRECSKSRIYGT